jgi:hypothetical protein
VTDATKLPRRMDRSRALAGRCECAFRRKAQRVGPCGLPTPQRSDAWNPGGGGDLPCELGAMLVCLTRVAWRA